MLIFWAALAAHWRFGGLLARYLLELGEVSSAYNFTLTNAAFLVLLLAAAATVFFGVEAVSSGLGAGRDRLKRKKEFP